MYAATPNRVFVFASSLYLFHLPYPHALDVCFRRLRGSRARPLRMFARINFVDDNRNRASPCVSLSEICYNESKLV